MFLLGLVALVMLTCVNAGYAASKTKTFDYSVSVSDQNQFLAVEAITIDAPAIQYETNVFDLGNYTEVNSNDGGYFLDSSPVELPTSLLYIKRSNFNYGNYTYKPAIKIESKYASNQLKPSWQNRFVHDKV